MPPAYDRWLDEHREHRAPSRMHLSAGWTAWLLHRAGLHWQSAQVVEYGVHATHTVGPHGVCDGAHPGGCLVAAARIEQMEDTT